MFELDTYYEGNHPNTWFEPKKCKIQFQLDIQHVSSTANNMTLNLNPTWILQLNTFLYDSFPFTKDPEM